MTVVIHVTKSIIVIEPNSTHAASAEQNQPPIHAGSQNLGNVTQFSTTVPTALSMK